MEEEEGGGGGVDTEIFRQYNPVVLPPRRAYRLSVRAVRRRVSGCSRSDTEGVGGAAVGEMEKLQMGGEARRERGGGGMQSSIHKPRTGAFAQIVCAAFPQTRSSLGQQQEVSCCWFLRRAVRLQSACKKKERRRNKERGGGEPPHRYVLVSASRI